MQTRTNPVHELSQKFLALFGAEARFVQAPGRVNLIGEHTDYNDGFVLPAAIQFQTTVAIAPRSDQSLTLLSENYAEQVEFSLEKLPAGPRQHWSDYVIGVAHQLEDLGVRLPGANLLIRGDVPQGSGLSSSASLEAAVCQAFLEVAQRTMGMTEIAKLCQRAENNFVGAHCGIMDQFASLHGRAGQLMKLDCRSLEFEYIPFDFPEYKLILVNSMVSHALAGTEYNIRRLQCEEGVAILQKHFPQARSLRDFTLAQIDEYDYELPDLVYRRCAFIIKENQRLLKGCALLSNKDLHRFGQLMYETHEGLSHEYEVSCKELDFLTASAKTFDGVVGARMMGGGFGGCSINIVKSSAEEAFTNYIKAAYEQEFDKTPEVYSTQIQDGAKIC